jgi:transposase
MDVEALQVAVDVGCRRHHAAIGNAQGRVLAEFEVEHTRAGFEDFFRRIEAQRNHEQPVWVAMEGCNGYARPLDQQVRARGYRLLNINNLKLARFKELFPGPAKTDALDTHRMLELLRVQAQVPLAKRIVREVRDVPVANAKLQRLTRRRRQLIAEKVRIVNRMQAELHAVCPGLLAITRSASSRWFLGLLACRDDLRQLARLRSTTLRTIRRVGVKHAAIIVAWQRDAQFSDDVEWAGPMIIADTRRLLILLDEIELLEKQIAATAPASPLYQRMTSIPGFGLVSCAELAGEIGDHQRFDGEASLALYLGATSLDNTSGQQPGTRTARQVNRRAKAALMNAVDHHRRHVPASRAYYEKQRAEGKKHNQAIRALARHLVRVLWSMFVHDRDYELRENLSRGDLKI